MASPEPIDPYSDPATGVLHNLLHLTERGALATAEDDLVGARLMALPLADLPATRDLGELCAIHRWLFQDLYGWAGTIRTVDIRKNTPGAEWFLPASMIPRSAGYAADELRADHHLQGLGRDAFVERLAHHYDQWNYLHPFREGNGRTQRVFWSRLARRAGWRLGWAAIDQAANDHASRLAAEGDLGPLIALLDQVVSARQGRHPDDTADTRLSRDDPAALAGLTGPAAPVRTAAARQPGLTARGRPSIDGRGRGRG